MADYRNSAVSSDENLLTNLLEQYLYTVGSDKEEEIRSRRDNLISSIEKQSISHAERIQALLNLGFCDERLGNPESAYLQYCNAMESADRNKLGRMSAAATLFAGMLLGGLGHSRFSKAKELLSSAVERFKRLNDSRGYIRSLVELGLISWLSDTSKEETIKILEKAREIQNKTGVEYELARTFHYLGILAMAGHKRIQAHEFFCEAQRRFELEKNNVGVSRVLDSLGTLHTHDGDFDDAVNCYNKSVEMKKSFGDLRGLATTYGNLGYLNMQLGRYEEAVKWYEMDVEISRVVGDSRGEAVALNRLGEVFALTNRYVESIECFNRVLYELKATQHIKMYTLLGLSKVNLHLDLDEAKAIARRLARVPPELKKEFEPDLLWLSGAIAWRDGNREKALRKLDEAVNSYKKRNSLHGVSRALREKYLLYKELDDRDGQIEILKSIWEITERMSASDLTTEIKYLLRSIDPAELRRAALHRFLPAPVISGIFSNECENLPASRRKISILFSDIRNFTNMSEQLAPEDVVKILNEYFRYMTEVIDRNDGLLDKYIGDAIMALFGAVQPYEDHAGRAVTAAVDMIFALEQFNRKNRSRGSGSFDIGIGVHTGEAVVGTIGCYRRYDYTAIGDSVNTASRLEGLTKQYLTPIIISESTYAELSQDVFCREIDLIRPKGKAKPVRIYEVLGYGDICFRPDYKKTLPWFKKGMEAYRGRNWREAKRFFEKALAADAADGPARIFIERVAEFSLNPPPEDWRGVTSLKK